MAKKTQIKSTLKTKLKVTTTAPQKTSTRDNFTKDTIDKLRRRAGNLCSNPECHKQTSEPQFINDEKPQILVLQPIFVLQL